MACLTANDMGDCGCGACVPTVGVCALYPHHTPAFTVTPCPIGTDCPATLVMKDGGGAVVYSATMPWDPANGYFASSCIFLSSTGLSGGPRYAQLWLYPVNFTLGYTVLVEHTDSIATCNALIIQNDDAAYHVATGLDQYSCDATGLHGHWITGSGSFLGDLFTYLGAADVYIDVPKFAIGCHQRFVATGCNSLPSPGILVSVWTNSGKVTSLGTGTTDAAGIVLIDLGAATSFYWEATHARFVTASNTETIAVGDSVGVSLTTPASGYHCITGCAIPVADTLHATHPVFGAITYAYSAGSWIGSTSYAYPGIGACAAKTVTISSIWDGGTGYADSWKYDGADCPDNAGANTATVVWTDGALVCPLSFTKTFSHTPSGTIETNLYGTSAMTLHLTE